MLSASMGSAPFVRQETGAQGRVRDLGLGPKLRNACAIDPTFLVLPAEQEGMPEQDGLGAVCPDVTAAKHSGPGEFIIEPDFGHAIRGADAESEVERNIIVNAG